MGNVAVDSIDKPNRDGVIARYALRDWLLKSYVEKNESTWQFASRWECLDLWAGLLGSMLRLDLFGRMDFYLLVTNGVYLLISQTFCDQTGQNSFEVRKDTNSLFFVLFWIRVHISVCLPVVICVRKLANELEEKHFEAAADWRSENFSVSCLLRSPVLAARGMWLSCSSWPVVTKLSDPSRLWSEIWRMICLRCKVLCTMDVCYWQGKSRTSLT